MTFSLTEDVQFDSAQVSCGMLPAALSLWSHDRSFCLLNKKARLLFKYSGADLVTRPSLWLERIHPDDRARFCQSVETLGKGNPWTQFDYRFFPRGEREPIWIREHAALVKKEKDPEIVSAYTEISDLRSTHGAEKKTSDNDETAKELMHNFQNVVQKVSMEVEFALMDLKRRFDGDDALRTIDSIDNSLQGLRDQIADILRSPTSQDPAKIVDGIVRQMRRDLNRQNVNLRLVRREPLPMVKGDKDQLRSAFEHVFEFCGSMLKNGGDLEVEARRKDIQGQVYVEVKVMSSSEACIKLGEKPETILSAGHQVGVGLALAREILARYRGQVFFQKEGKNRGQVTIRIKASP